MQNKWIVCAVMCALSGVGGWAGEAWETDRMFWLDLNWPDAEHYNQHQTSLIDAQTTKGTVRGKTLSKETVAALELPNVQFGAPKNLPTGATDQAVVWSAEGCINPTAGAISIFVQGKQWGGSGPQRETLIVCDGPDGSLAFEKSKPNTLAVVVNGTPVIETPLAEPNQLHHVVVNFTAAAGNKGGVIALYVDRHLVGSKEGVTLPGRYDRVVVGQLGPGPGTNKILDNIAIYRRPLAPGEITKIYYLEGKFELPKLVTVPFTAKPPKIDGIFEAGEWDQAAGIGGFMERYTGKPWEVEDTIRLAYDNQYLYFAYRCPPPARILGNAPMIAAMLKNSRTGYDTDVEADDALWIDIEKPHAGGDMYHFCVNGSNTHYDFSEGGSATGSIEKGINLHFDPHWITASTLTMEGWKLEGAIPFRDLKMEPPQPGQQMYLNFTRYWRTVLGGIVQWSYGTQYGQAQTGNWWAPTSPVRFGEPGGVTVQLERIGNMIQGLLDVRAQLINAGAKPATVRLEMTSNSGEIQEARNLEVPAHGSTPYEFQARVTKPETGTVALRVTDAATGTLLFVSSHPLLRADHPSIYLRKYPSWNLMKFETEFDALSAVPAKDITAELEIAPAAARAGRRDTERPTGGHRPPPPPSSRPVAKQKADGFTSYRHIFEVATKGLPAGPYVAVVRFLRNGRVLDTTRQEFEVKPLPEWYNNTIGYDDPEKTPYPFTRMELRDANDVCVWGRIYRWGESLLPTQIEINPNHANPMTRTPAGQGILRSPMRLTGQAGGKQFTTDQLQAIGQWTEKSGVRILGKRSVVVGNLSITADVRVEFDGFCWVKLTLAPVQGTVELQSLAFEEPFRPEFSDVVNAGEYSLAGTGKFPDKLFQKSATLPIWVGNGDGGLQTFLETLATWHVKDPQTTMQLLPGKEGGTMRYNLVDQPLSLSQPRVIEFGWNATPTRVKDWRTFREQSRDHRNSYFTWYPGAEWNVGDLGWTNTYYNGGGGVARYDIGVWERGQPYLNTDYVPINDPDVQEFGDEWLANMEDRWRDRIGLTGEKITVTYHAKSYRDWVMWRMNELFKKAPFTGWYYDVVSTCPSANPYANAGLVLADGTRVPTASLLGLRDLTKRLYTLCRRTYPDGAAMIHSSGMPNMAYMAFCEILFDGENLNSSINAQQPTYRGVLTPERFRAEYRGHNFGPQLWWLGQNRISLAAARQYGPDVLADHVAGLMLLHETPVIFGGGFGGLAYGTNGTQICWHCDHAARRTFEAIRRYDLYGCGYQFLPYWRDNAVSGLKDRQFVSWYVRQTVGFQVPPQQEPPFWRFWTREETDDTLPHRAIGIFCNESDWQGELKVQVDLKKLGFKDGMKIRAINAVHSTGYRIENAETPQEKGVFFPKPEENASLTGNELRFPMTDWNYRMIVLEELK